MFPNFKLTVLMINASHRMTGQRVKNLAAVHLLPSNEVNANAYSCKIGVKTCHRMGITSNSDCVICGEKETVLHQLFQCSNASRMWQLLHKLGGTTEPKDDKDCFNHILVSNDYLVEILKAFFFKLLIQIDRSANLTTSQIMRKLDSLLTIEFKSICKLRNSNHTQIKRLLKTLQLLKTFT